MLPMTCSFNDFLAIAALLLWPAIPLFWIPVHCVPGLFRRLGFFTYILPFITWLPIAYITFGQRNVLLRHRIELPAMANLMGLFLLILGAGLQAWTLALLTLPVIMGMPEVTKSVPGKLVTTGPFGIVRHPTYLSHTLMLLGLFLMTGVTALGIVMVIDAIVVNSIVIPLEEKELLQRFGKEYEEYRQKVQPRFLPLRRSR
jgi:protein-S-isoprenylcysteine O-methyltransferase Ste14